jgi:hypothetical protein
MRIRPLFRAFVLCLLVPALVWAPASVRSAESGGAEPPPNTLSEAERAAGWRLLFDGRTTQGWRGYQATGFPKKGWVVEQGWLRHQARGGGGDLVTEETFAEFELTFDWKVGAGSNSGLKYFVAEERSSAIGHEYQVIDDPPYGFAQQGNTHQTASFYDVLPQTVYRPPRPPGEVNQSRILVKGNHVEHWLNGEKVLAYELDSAAVKAAVARSKFRDVKGFGTRMKGHVLLQDHGGDVWFRNMKVRP